MAGIQILRSCGACWFAVMIFRCLSVASFLLWGHCARSGLQVSQVKHLCLLCKPWGFVRYPRGRCKMVSRLCREIRQYKGKIIQEQTQWSHLLCFTAPHRLSFALTVPSRCSPVVKSSREAGQASALLPSKSNTGFVSVASPAYFYCALNLWAFFTCGHREQVILFCGFTSLWLRHAELSKSSSGTCSEMREHRAPLLLHLPL